MTLRNSTIQTAKTGSWSAIQDLRKRTCTLEDQYSTLSRLDVLAEWY